MYSYIGEGAMDTFEISVYIVSLSLFFITFIFGVLNIPLIWRNREPIILGNLFFARNIALVISCATIITLKLSMLHAYVYEAFIPHNSGILLIVEYMLAIVLLTDVAISRAFLQCNMLSLVKLDRRITK